MKKLLALCFLFLLVQGAYAQLTQKDVEDTVNKCISLLGKSVPEGSIRMGRSMFKVPYKDWEIVMVVENGLIYVTSYGSVHYSTDMASAFLGSFYTFFEDSGSWKYVGRGSVYDDVYYNNEVYAALETYKREDGLIVAMVLFSKFRFM
jgi:hypothetical protein